MTPLVVAAVTDGHRRSWRAAPILLSGGIVAGALVGLTITVTVSAGTVASGPLLAAALGLYSMGRLW